MATETQPINSAKSKASFSVKKVGVLTIKGNLSEMSGQITFDPNDLANAGFNVCVNTATIDTNNPKRDEHLRAADFFDVEKHPTICFKSTSVTGSSDQYTAKGTLSLLEKTQTVDIPFTYSDGNFSGQLMLNRFDYGLGTKFPSLIVGKNIEIKIECTLG
ncbi:MAG: YceI family protein [Bacteroidota bacterium]